MRNSIGGVLFPYKVSELGVINDDWVRLENFFCVVWGGGVRFDSASSGVCLPLGEQDED